MKVTGFSDRLKVRMYNSQSFSLMPRKDGSVMDGDKVIRFR